MLQLRVSVLGRLRDLQNIFAVISGTLSMLLYGVTKFVVYYACMRLTVVCLIGLVPFYVVTSL